MEIVGTIDACISLAQDLRKLVQRYTGASESSSQMRLFDSQLGIIRLRLLRTAIAGNINILGREAQQAIRPALRNLQDQLDTAVANLPDVKTALDRMSWVFSKETTNIEGFKAIHEHMLMLQSIVELARLAPKQKSLTADDPDNFTLCDLKSSKTIKNNRIYSVMAHWKGSAPLEAERPAVRVLVETFRGPTEQDDTRREKLAGRIAEKLWWSCDDNPGFQTGVLPYIGFDKFRLISLLPRNVKDQQTLRDLICGKEKEGERMEAPLEARFSLALQLAEALLKVHSAGVVHCDIRSDAILFLTPEEGEELPAPHGPTGVKGQECEPTKGVSEKTKSEPTKLPPLKRSNSWQKTSGFVGGLVRRVTGTRDESTDNFGKGSKTTQHKPTRQTSQRSLRKKSRSREIKTKNPFMSHHEPSSESLSATEDVNDDPNPNKCDSINPRAGDIPPGFGSVYLIDWASMRYRGSSMNPHLKNWAKDI